MADSDSDEDDTMHNATIVALMELQSAQSFRSGCLSKEGRQRKQRSIPRCALLDPTAAPWHKLYNSKNNQALITVTGFDHTSFHYMLQDFRHYFYNYTPWTGENDGRTYKKLKKKYGFDRSRISTLPLALSRQ